MENFEAKKVINETSNNRFHLDLQVPFLNLLAGLCWYGIVGYFVFAAAVLLYAYGFIFFWIPAFAKKTYTWQEQMQKWYMDKVAMLFKENGTNSRLKQLLRLIIDLLFILFPLWPAATICFAYGIIMCWCSFGKRNFKWLKRMLKWYTRRLSATIRNDYSVSLFSKDEEAEFYDLHLNKDGSLDMRFNENRE